MSRPATRWPSPAIVSGEMRYFDAVVADVAGEPETIANAVCPHEEDAGSLGPTVKPKRACVRLR